MAKLLRQSVPLSALKKSGEVRLSGDPRAALRLLGSLGVGQTLSTS